MIIQEIADLLEQWAPLSYQESYDNSGLILGHPSTEVSSALITLDCTEEVIQEAIDKNCQLVIAHHPIIFTGIKKLTGKNYVERTILKAIKNDIAIYAIHTNLDTIQSGVNHMMAEKLGLENCRVLSPKKNILRKLVTYIPVTHYESVRISIFAAGAGNIGNYSHCGFAISGTGSFKGNENSNPTLGNVGEITHTEELRFETIFPDYLEAKIIQALVQSHPYEEVAFDIYSMENAHAQIGAGLLGELPVEMALVDFLNLVKERFLLKSVKYTPLDKKVKKIALCGGSGSFLRFQAAASAADVYLSADFKYHEWFDAEGHLSYIDLGHYESEQFTKELIFNYLGKKALSLHSQISKVNTNPVNYL